MDTIKCPRCGLELLLIPHPVKRGRVIANCRCNPLGPVYEGNAPASKAVVSGIRDLPIDDETVRAMNERGYFTLSDVAGASDEELLEIPGIGPATLKKIRDYLEVTTDDST